MQRLGMFIALAVSMFCFSHELTAQNTISKIVVGNSDNQPNANLAAALAEFRMFKDAKDQTPVGYVLSDVEMAEVTVFPMPNGSYSATAVSVATYKSGSSGSRWWMTLDLYEVPFFIPYSQPPGPPITPQSQPYLIPLYFPVD